MSRIKICIATSNAHKISEFREMFANAKLECDVFGAGELSGFEPPEEDGKTFSENITYGPANEKAYDLLDQSIIDTLPSAPKYKDMVATYNPEYWAENYDAVNEKFQAWLLE